eukprot:g26206.t1
MPYYTATKAAPEITTPRSKHTEAAPTATHWVQNAASAKSCLIAANTAATTIARRRSQLLGPGLISTSEDQRTIQVAHPLVQQQLVDYVHNGFLVPVMGPALHK